MVTIRQVTNPKEKANICSTILHALPSWFGIESSIADYIEKVQPLPFWTAFDDEKPIGFAALQVHNTFTAEVCVMGILEAYHRQGIGNQLIACCESFCTEHQFEYLTVKTLDESAQSSSYAKTRKFYLAMGFRPLEVFPLLWDKNNPCLFMAKYLPAKP